MTQIIEQLAALAEKAPEICRAENGNFIIGEYSFWYQEEDNQFTACHDQVRNGFLKGRPALAWLTGAIMAECERRGGYLEIHYSPSRKKFKAEIANETAWSTTAAEALLTAFLAAVEWER